jgi:hypothetical protein
VIFKGQPTKDTDKMDSKLIIGLVALILVGAVIYLVMFPSVGGGGGDVDEMAYLSNGNSFLQARENPALASDAIVCNDFNNRQAYLNFDCAPHSPCDDMGLVPGGTGCSPLNPYTPQSTDLSYCYFKCQVIYGSFIFIGVSDVATCITKLETELNTLSDVPSDLESDDYNCYILDSPHPHAGSCRCRRTDYIDNTQGLV